MSELHEQLTRLRKQHENSGNESPDDEYEFHGFAENEFSDEEEYTEPNEMGRGPGALPPAARNRRAPPAPPKLEENSDNEEEYLEPTNGGQGPPPRAAGGRPPAPAPGNRGSGPPGRPPPGGGGRGFRAPPPEPVYDDSPPAPAPPRGSARIPPPVPTPIRGAPTPGRAPPPVPATHNRAPPSPPPTRAPLAKPPEQNNNSKAVIVDEDTYGEIDDDMIAEPKPAALRPPPKAPPEVPPSNTGNKSFLFSQARKELEAKLQGRSGKDVANPTPPVPVRAAPAPQQEEEDGETYEAVDPPPRDTPKRTFDHKLPPPPVTQPPLPYAEEEYTELPDAPSFGDEEYTMPEPEPQTTRRPVVPKVPPPATRAPPPPPAKEPHSPPAVQEKGIRIGDTAVMNAIRARGEITTKHFEDPLAKKNKNTGESKAMNTSGGVRGIAAQLEGKLGLGGGGAPVLKPPPGKLPVKPPAKPTGVVAPSITTRTSSNNHLHNDPGTDTGYESGAPVERLSSISTSSTSTTGSRDSIDPARPPPSLPPRREDIPLPEIPPVGETNSLSGEPWYHPIQDRKEAARLVTEAKRTGSFLIRDSAKKADQPYTLVVLHCNNLKNIPIRKRRDGKFAFGSAKIDETAFADIVDMVDYHRTTAILLDGGGEVTLKNPVHK